MDRPETLKILATLSAAYPQQYSKIEDKVKNKMIQVWNSLFENDNYEVVGQALKNYILNDTKGFLPPVGAIKEEIRKILYPNELTEQEAVNIIMDKLSWKSSKKAFESLPSVLKKVVGNSRQLSTWGYMDVTTVQSVVSSNLQRSLKTLLDQERQSQRTGTYKPYIKEQIETQEKPKRLENKKTKQAENEEKELILKTIAEARKRASDVER